MSNILTTQATKTFPTGAIAYWSLGNDGSGNLNLTDLTGNGNTLTNNGGVTLGTGLLSGCAVFNPNNNTYLYISPNNAFNFSGDFSIQAWINSAGQTRSYPAIFSSQYGWVTNSVKLDFFYANNQAIGYEHNGTIVNGIVNSSNATVGVWYHAVIVKQNNLATLYINNVAVASQNDNILAAFNNNNSGTVIGGGDWDGYNSYFNGSLCEIGVWNRALSPNEISILYNRGNAFSYNSTISLQTNPQFITSNPRFLTNQLSAVSTQPSLLMVMNNNFNDSSTYNNSITINTGTPIIKSFNDLSNKTYSAGYFNGSSSLVLNDASEFNLASVPSTIEAWFYAKSLYTNGNAASTIISKDTYGSNFSWCIAIYSDAIFVGTDNINGNWNFTSTGLNITTNTWHHVAFCSDGSNQYMYLDGNLVGSVNFPLTDASSNISIGCMSYNNLGNYFNGYIQDIRVTQGTMIYHSNFTPLPPISNLPPITNNAQIITTTVSPQLPTGNITLLLDATNTSSYSGSGGVWYDVSGNGNNFNINSAAFNSGSKYMDFKGSYGMAKNSSDINLSGDVTYICATRILNSAGDWRTLTRAYGSPGNHQVIVQSGGWDIGTYIGNGSGFRDTGYSQQSLPGYASNSFDIMCWRWTDGDNPTYNLNVNGVNVGSITDSVARYVIGFGSIGGYHNGNTDPNSGSQYWGDIKYFIVYNRRLTDVEVRFAYSYLKSYLGI